MAEISLQGVNAYANQSSFLDNHLAQKAGTAIPEAEATKVAEASTASDAIKESQKESSAAKEDTVVIKESEQKTANESISDILAEMRERVSKLGEDGAGRDAVNKELEGLRKELSGFVQSYNDAMSFATSFGADEAINRQINNLTNRTNTYSGALQGIGVSTGPGNAMSLVSSLQMPTAGERAAIKSLFGGDYSYGAKTLESFNQINNELNKGRVYSAKTYDPMNVAGVE
jgi:hypothetical protein